MDNLAYPRTDLACETRPPKLPPMRGIRAEERMVGRITLSDLSVLDDAAAELIGKPCGRYVTLSLPHLWKCTEEDYAAFRDLLAEKILDFASLMTGKRPDAHFGVLIAGLGNRDITPDAIGPQTTEKLAVTRHLRDYDPEAYAVIGRCALSALAPGVLGQTGIETVELVRGAAENAEPDLVIAVDALVARSCERLASTVQLCDRGIDPGSGIGNNRRALCRDSVGVPVLAMGVPTVVDSATLVYDALARAGIGEIGDELRGVLENGRGFFVSPKEGDVITARLSSLLADAIEHAFTLPE